MIEYKDASVPVLDWVASQATLILNMQIAGYEVDLLYKQLADACNKIGERLGDYPGKPVMEPGVKVSLVTLVAYSYEAEREDFLSSFGWDFCGVSETAFVKILASSTDLPYAHVLCHICRVRLWLKEF